MANENKEKIQKPPVNFANIIIIILLVLILALVAGFVIYSLFFNKSSKSASARSTTAVVTTAATAAATTENNISEYTYDMKDQFLGNLAEDNGKKAYVQAKISLGYNTKAAAKMTKELTDKNSEARDVIYSVLLTKKSSDLNTASGREAAKKEIIDRLKSLYTNGQVNNVYFYDIVIQ